MWLDPPGSQPCSATKKWLRVAQIKCLGRWIQHTNSCNRDLSAFTASVWGALWRNNRLLRGCLPPVQQARLIDRCCRSIPSRKVVEWPYTQSRALALDRLQRSVVARCNSLKRWRGEPVNAWRTRASRAASSAIASSTGSWSALAREQQRKWMFRLRRHPELPGSRLLNWHDVNWLDRQRQNAAGTTTAVLNTRVAGVGRPTARWAEQYRWFCTPNPPYMATGDAG